MGANVLSGRDAAPHYPTLEQNKRETTDQFIVRYVLVRIAYARMASWVNTSYSSMQ